MSPVGTTAAAPPAMAVAIVVEARRTSITTAIPPAVVPCGIPWKQSWHRQVVTAIVLGKPHDERR
jgi:hypothetical protein